ncbi:hypothetical protein GCM10011326_09730 [Salipiger profundus]|nr:hypothetical protein GCM10011326_09730 [Salipiger profundus]
MGVTDRDRKCDAPFSRFSGRAGCVRWLTAHLKLSDVRRAAQEAGETGRAGKSFARSGAKGCCDGKRAWRVRRDRKPRQSAGITDRIQEREATSRVRATGSRHDRGAISA